MFVDILLPIKTDILYTYKVPQILEKEIEIGKRVIVQFGKKKQYSAIIIRKYPDKKVNYKVKELIKILDDEALISKYQIEFWNWLSDYYLASLGEVMDAALPNLLKLESTTQIVLTKNKEEIENLSEKEKELLKLLNRRKKLTLDKIRAAAQNNYSNQLINNVLEKTIVKEEEEINYKEFNQNPNDADFSYKKQNIKELSEKQQESFIEINNSFKNKDVTLLWGITSSGKTEIYIKLIEQYLNEAKQILYLLPEIALTMQIITRLKSVFADNIAIYHSKVSEKERIDIYYKVKNGMCKIILGVRSSIFLPFNDLGLIIIDEEHENTYKQFNPAPRYNARDSAIMLAKIHSAKVLLGSATPSLETFFNTINEKYAIVKLWERYKNIELPKIELVDIGELRKKKQMQSHFSPILIEKIKEKLKKNEQIILFQNRRAYSNFVECSVCSEVPYCPNCNVSLTYHKKLGRIICHYCDYSEDVITNCKKCGSSKIIFRGFGTEKVEDEAQKIFPSASIARLDTDTSRNYEKILREFEQNKINILVGTQMVAKGLDFDNVSLVSILNADNLINFPDFRALERSIQLMSQVSGRAGRRDKQGEVIIQTSNPEHQIFQDIILNDLNSFYSRELLERKAFAYPPYIRLIKINVKHKSQEVSKTAAEQLANMLKKIFKTIIGPYSPVIDKMQNYFIQEITLKISKNDFVNKYKITDCFKELNSQKQYSQVKFVVDVDRY